MHENIGKQRMSVYDDNCVSSLSVAVAKTVVFYLVRNVKEGLIYDTLNSYRFLFARQRTTKTRWPVPECSLCCASFQKLNGTFATILSLNLINFSLVRNRYYRMKLIFKEINARDDKLDISILKYCQSDSPLNNLN